MTTTISIPRLSLVLLIGPTGSGKSTFAAKHFSPNEVLSSDRMRAAIDDDENSQTATADAFEVMRLVAAKRLARGRLTVVDATNVNYEDRRPFVKLAEKYHAAPIAIVLNVDRKICHERNNARADRRGMGAHVVERHAAAMEKSLATLRREGFYRVHVFSDPNEIDTLAVEREKMRADRCDERGPFDIIGDVHGCCEELERLLTELGYARGDDGVWRHPQGRRAIFLGDLINRGPRSLDTLRLVMAMAKDGAAISVAGNHEDLLLKWLLGKPASPAHGLKQTLDESDKMPLEEWNPLKAELTEFLKSLESHLIFDGGRLIAAHGGMTPELAGRMSVRHFALYGETRGEIDGFAKRQSPLWAQRYRAKARLIYGHAAVAEPKRVHNTLNIDTGCVFGGKLTALRYPEGDLVSVPAATTYFEPAPGHQPRKESQPDEKPAPVETQASGAGEAPAGEVAAGEAAAAEGAGAEAAAQGMAPEAAQGMAPEAAQGMAPEAAQDMAPKAAQGMAPEAAQDMAPEAAQGMAPEMESATPSAVDAAIEPSAQEAEAQAGHQEPSAAPGPSA